jgi:hypothetical protein
MKRGRSARTTHVARVTSLPHEPSNKDVQLLLCQQVLLTATLPPSQEGQLRETMLMPQATVLRAETTQRLGTCYAVVRCQRRAELRAMAVRLARTLMDEARCLPCALPLPLQAIESATKGIVYCRSKRLCNELAGALGCPKLYDLLEAGQSKLYLFRLPLTLV